MNMFNILFKRLAAALAVTSTALSCSLDETADIRLVELGTALEDNVCLIEAAGGPYELSIYSNGDYHIEMLSEASWLTMSALEGNGDGVLKLTATQNPDFKRMVTFVLCSDVDSRRDTVYVKQKGSIEANLSVDNTSIVLNGAGGQSAIAINTNIPADRFDIKVDYDLNDTDGVVSTGWLETSMENTSLNLTSIKNDHAEAVRTASVLLSFVDGWGDKVALELNVLQKNSNEMLGVIKSFKEVRDMVVGTDAVVEYEVEDDIILEGVVVSNPLYGNAGENEQTNNTSIDYTGTQRTIYLQSLDGKYGFAIMAASAEDNVFNQFDKVQVLLKGTKITKYSSPERYVVSGFVKRMKASQVPASESEIVKEEKYFKDLTPEDIYTYKTLMDVEFPVRKGSLTPINEGYAIGGKSDRISKYPLLVRDVNGDSFYMYTNTMCTYRYDGERLPQGSGKLSGVIVHERFSRFEWENGKDLLDMEIFPELGNIGTYQIRHQQKSDITDGMAMDYKDSFSELLLEYRYWNPDTENGVMRPSYGENGWFTHTYQQKYTGSASLDYTAEDHYNQHLMPEVSFSYLGKVGISGNEFFEPATGNVNGFGIVLDSENDQYNIEMSDWVGEHNGKNEWMAPIVTDEENGIRAANGGSQGGKGQCPADCYCSFRNVYWWDFEAGRGYAWMLNFSTKNVSKSLSLQFTALNTSQLFYSPRFWKIEWSEVDSMAASDDDKWHLITEYTVPDISQWTGTLYSSCVGYKAMDVRLPDELLGKDNVYIRFMPTSVACSSGADYTDTVLDDDAHYESGKHSSSIDYISIRYNK